MLVIYFLAVSSPDGYFPPVLSDGLYLIIYLSFLGDLKQRKLLIKQDFPFLELNVNKSVKRLPVRLMIVKNWFKI